jgi:hypothetical protein
MDVLFERGISARKFSKVVVDPFGHETMFEDVVVEGKERV